MSSFITPAAARLVNRFSRKRIFPASQPFYKQYPYTHGPSLRSADARGCIDFELGFFCNRIPKAANSTVVATLASLKMHDKVGSKDAKRLFVRPSDLSAEQMLGFEDLYKFMVVRNPYARTLSAYLDKVKRKQDDGNWRGKAHDFHSFLKWLNKGKLYSNAHWAPQSSLLLIPFSQFQFVGKVESLQQDLHQVLGRLAGDSDEAMLNPVMSNATGASDKLNRYYDAETQQLVQQLYQRDFELFDYSFDL